MRTHAVRSTNEAAPSPVGVALRGRSFPVQAKLKAASIEEDATALENRAGETSRSGASFSKVRVFPEQPDFAGSGAGSPLPESLQRKMEAAFHADFSNVRVHQGPDAASLSALAFTQGRDINFAPGQYNPSSLEGQKIIAHELAHVVQQRQGKVAVPQGKGAPINADPVLEAEADSLGRKAVQGQVVQPALPGHGAAPQPGAAIQRITIDEENKNPGAYTQQVGENPADFRQRMAQEMAALRQTMAEKDADPDKRSQTDMMQEPFKFYAHRRNKREAELEQLRKGKLTGREVEASAEDPLGNRTVTTTDVAQGGPSVTKGTTAGSSLLPGGMASR
jgi:hypothetical protein